MKEFLNKIGAHFNIETVVITLWISWFALTFGCLTTLAIIGLGTTIALIISLHKTIKGA